MKTAGIVTLLLIVTFLLSGCGHYGMGMGRHYYGDVHVNQNDRDFQSIAGNDLMASAGNPR